KTNAKYKSNIYLNPVQKIIIIVRKKVTSKQRSIYIMIIFRKVEAGNSPASACDDKPLFSKWFLINRGSF
ncbi:hypothetical protein, partial [Serratia marcescens]|uniref:hypothetical protein n=1 Tax=Serratia marcescens TaxID=615 RepID=UPI001CA38368